MSRVAILARTLSVPLSAADLADAFCQLNAGEQAQFFVHVDRAMEGWRAGDGSAAAQRHAIAQHLTGRLGARHWLEELVAAIQEAQ